MMLGGFVVIAFFAIVAISVVAFVVALTRRNQIAGLPQRPPRAIISQELAQLDRALAAGQISAGDYELRRSQLLGLPRPEAR
jgi:hypothetical protein